MKVVRFAQNPLVSPASSPAIGSNINGPSVIRKPEWLTRLPGQYLMYFAHHQGNYIRLAWAETLHGPWNIFNEEIFPLEEAPCESHVASPDILPNMRHAAVRLKSDDTLDIFYSRGGYCPERILYCSMSLKDDWLQWRPGEPITVLEPEHYYEGVNEPLDASNFGWAPESVRQLRDPAVYEEDGRIFLFYSNAGEQGICGAEVKGI